MKYLLAIVLALTITACGSSSDDSSTPVEPITPPPIDVPVEPTPAPPIVEPVLPPPIVEPCNDGSCVPVEPQPPIEEPIEPEPVPPLQPVEPTPEPVEPPITEPTDPVPPVEDCTTDCDVYLDPDLIHVPHACEEGTEVCLPIVDDGRPVDCVPTKAYLAQGNKEEYLDYWLYETNPCDATFEPYVVADDELLIAGENVNMIYGNIWYIEPSYPNEISQYVLGGNFETTDTLGEGDFVRFFENTLEYTGHGDYRDGSRHEVEYGYRSRLSNDLWFTVHVYTDKGEIATNFIFPFSLSSPLINCQGLSDHTSPTGYSTNCKYDGEWYELTPDYLSELPTPTEKSLGTDYAYTIYHIILNDILDGTLVTR